MASCAALTRFSYEPKADLSYGTYLYGWPIQQSLQRSGRGIGRVLLMPSLAITC